MCSTINNTYPLTPIKVLFRLTSPLHAHESKLIFYIFRPLLLVLMTFLVEKQSFLLWYGP